MNWSIMKDKNNWNGILRIDEIQHIGVDGSILRREENIHNTLHLEGEEFLLRAAFTGGQVSSVIPENYYVGLDSRSDIEDSQTMDDIIGEPVGSGYARQSISSSGDFVINFEESHFLALSPIVIFNGIGGSWGPVSNLFFTDRIDNAGSLISSATFSAPFSVANGESITLRVSMLLRDCEACPT
jgi:hypothetical protein